MMEFLEFTFRGFWTFWGMVILLEIAVSPFQVLAAYIGFKCSKKKDEETDNEK